MPCGSFFLHEGSKPVVLIAGGVGLTPMISMLESLMTTKANREVTFVQCTKNPETHAMAGLVDDLTGSYPNLNSHVLYSTKCEASTPLANTKVHTARLTPELLTTLVPKPVTGNDFYFCGPPAFLGSVRRILEEMDVPEAQAHYEYFGPTEQ